MRSSKTVRDDSSRDDDGFDHSSEHVDLDALLAEHLGGSKAAEAVVEGMEARRRARQEHAAGPGR